MPVMLIFLAALQTAPPTAPTPQRPVARYLSCVRKDAAAAAGRPKPLDQIDTVLAACEPLASDAAKDFAAEMYNDPAMVEAMVTFHQKHGTDPDLVKWSTRALHQAARDGAAEMLAGHKGPVNVHESMAFEDGDALPATK